MSSPSPTGQSEDTSSGANYFFFGLLITFVGLLVIFVACGIGSRRRFTARGGTTLHHDGIMQRREGEGPPEFYEYSFVIGESGWNNLMPLSVIFWQEKEEKESSSVEHNLQALPPAAPAPRRSRNIFGRILPRRHRDKNPSLPTRTEPEPPDTIQVAVMIVMPCSRDPSLETYDFESKSPEPTPEYQIGAIRLPWKQEQVTLAHPEFIADGNP